MTNYINDISVENTQVLETTDVDGNYHGVYTYDNTGTELISEQDLGHVEGKPNDPLYYLKDAIGSVTAITNMNSEIIDSNRFAPYGEALDPVGKNARLTNSPFGYTGETHDIEGGLVYLRARYYEPDTMRFLQQDTVMGDVKEPVTWNLYAYAGNNPVNNIDPSGHWYLNVGSTGNDVKVLQRYLKVAGDYAVSGKETYGYYSDIVKSSVKGWQKGHNKPYTIRNEYGEPELKYRTQISADGLAGTETWKAMGYKMTSSGQPDRNSKEYVGSLNMANQESSKNVVSTPKTEVPSVDLTVGAGLVAPLPHRTEVDIPTPNKPWNIPTPKIETPKIEVGRVTGLIGVLLMLLSLRGDSDQRPLDQKDENIRISQESLKKLKNNPNIKLDKDEKGRVIIYRKGKLNLNTLTPREDDAPALGQKYTDYLKENNTDTIGMSWTLKKPEPGTKYVQTTIEQVNETGLLIAFYDGGKDGNHVSIIPATDGPWNNYKNLTNWALTKKYLNPSLIDTYDPSKVSFYTKNLQNICTGPLGQPIPNLLQK